MQSRELMHNQPRAAYLCGGRIFSNTPHFRRIKSRFQEAKYAEVAWFHNNNNFRCKKVTYILAESWKMLRLLHTSKAPFSPYCHGNLMKWRNYVTWTSSANPAVKPGWNLKRANHSYLPTKISAKDRAKQFPNLLHDSGAKLYCENLRKHAVKWNREKKVIPQHPVTTRLLTLL